MKNYDIKSAVAELSVAPKVVESSKRIAFLVPNMFSRVCTGYDKKNTELKQSSVQNIVPNQANVNSTMEGTIANNVGNTTIPSVEVRSENAVNEISTVKEEIVASDRVNVNPVVDNKSYILKISQADAESLKRSNIKVVNSPRRLLISLVFIEKLFTNRKNKMLNVNAQMASNKTLSVQTVSEPVVSTGYVQSTNAEQKDVSYAKEKYKELNTKRLSLLDELNKCQEEMKKLVNEYNLTQEMIRG